MTRIARMGLWRCLWKSTAVFASFALFVSFGSSAVRGTAAVSPSSVIMKSARRHNNVGKVAFTILTGALFPSWPVHVRLRAWGIVSHQRPRRMRQLLRHERALRGVDEVQSPAGCRVQRLSRPHSSPASTRRKPATGSGILLLHHRALPRSARITPRNHEVMKGLYVTATRTSWRRSITGSRTAMMNAIARRAFAAMPPSATG